MSCFNPKRILVPIALSFLLADLARENGGLLGQRFFVTREKLQLITDIRDLTTLFHVILSCETSERFIKSEDIKFDLCTIIAVL